MALWSQVETTVLPKHAKAWRDGNRIVLDEKWGGSRVEGARQRVRCEECRRVLLPNLYGW